MIARVKDIKTKDNLNIVEFDFNNISLKMMSLELNKDITIGKRVEPVVKPTNIIISKNFIEDISLSNQTLAKVIEINSGELLSNITLKIEETILESIITKDSADKLNLKIDDKVYILIKASDLSILKVLND